MANGGRIDWTLGFKVDRSGLEQIKSELTKLSSLTTQDFLKMRPDLKGLKQADSELIEIKETISKVSQAYSSAFNSTTGVTNITKLANSLNSIGVNKLYTDFQKLGPSGVKAFNDITSQALRTSLRFKETSNWLDRMGVTLKNTLKWSISSSAINTFTGAVQQAYGYVQHLDTSLNDIRIVTGKSADEMDKFAEKANDAAKALGASTTDYTEAALIYYQQGLSDEESQARAETTLKAANVTGQTGREVSEQLTAVWNGYKVSAEETEMYVDKLAAVAATTASDLEELSTGMSKVASAANNMGVDIDQLNAQLATIVSVTRQAPETAGTALKTIYARLEDLKISGEDEEGVKLGEVSSTLDELGIHVLDAEGNLRDLGEVIEEVAAKWDTWTDAQQSAAAQAMAGKRQYNNLLALFDNWDMYTSALETSRNSLGTLQQQQDIYMESTAAHLQQMKTEWEDLYDSLISTEDINSIVDGFTAVLDKVTSFVDSIGGGKGVLLGLGSVATAVFRNQISKSLAETVNNFNNVIYNAEQYNVILNSISQLEASSPVDQRTPALQLRLDLMKELLDNYHMLSSEEINEKLTEIDIIANKQAELDIVEKTNEELEERVQIYAKLQQRINTTTTGKEYNTKDVRKNAADAMNFKANSTENLPQAQQVLQTQSSKNTAVEQGMVEYQKSVQKVIDLRTKLNKLIEKGPKDNSAEELAKYDKELDKLKTHFQEATTEARNLNKELKSRVQATGYDNEEKILGQIKKTDEAVNKLGKTIDQTKARTDGVAKSINSLQSKVNNATSEMKGDIQQANEGLDQSIEKTAQLKAEVELLRQTYQRNMEGVSIQKFTQGITQAAQGAMQLGFAFSSIKGLKDTLSNDELSFTEKLGQSLSSIGMIITGVMGGLPALASGFGAISKGIHNFSGLMDSAKIALLSYTNSEGLALATKEAFVAATEAEKIAIAKELGYQSASEVVIDKNTSATVLNTMSKMGNASATDILNTKTVLATTSTNLLTAAWARFSAVIKSLWATNPVVIIAAIAAAAAKAGIELRKFYAEQQAATAEKDLGIAQEDNQKAKEYSDSVKEVINQYKELKETHEDNLPKLRSAIYDVIKAHNIQIDTVDLLTADYEHLDEIMTNVQTSARKAENESQKALIEAQKRNLIAQSEKSTSENATVIKDYGVGSISNANMSVEVLKETGLEAIDAFGNVNWDVFYNASQEQQQIIMNILSDYAAWNDRAKDALNAIREHQSEITDLQNTEKEYNKSIADEIFTELTQNKEITTVEDYNEIKEQLANRLAEQLSISYEEGLKLAEERIKSEDNLIKINAGFELGEKLSNSYNQSVESIANQISQLSGSDIEFLNNNLDLAKAYDSLDDFFNAYKELRDALQKKDNLLKIQTVFENSDGKSFKPEDLDVLFEYQAFSKDLGKTQDEFEQQTYQQQMSDLLTYYWTANKLESDYNASKKKALIDEQTEKKNQIEEEKRLLDELKEKIISTYNVDEQVLDEGYYNSRKASFESASNRMNETYGYEVVESDAGADILKKYVEGKEELNEVEKKYLQYLAEENGTTVEGLKGIYNRISAYEDFSNRLEELGIQGKSYQGIAEDLEKQLNEIDGVVSNIDLSNLDWSSFGEGVQQLLEYTQSSIDELQGAYSSLTSVMEEYNETGVLSMDNLQTLLNMDTQYLAALQMENGQLVLNEDSLKQMALARLDEAEAEAYMQAMTELNNEERRQEILSSGQAVTALDALGTGATKAAEAARNGVDAWNAYWAAALHEQGKQKDEYTQMVGDALRNKLQAIDQVRQQILSGGFESTMKGPEKESSNSSTSKEKEAKHEDHLEREADLYRNINSELKQIESTLGRIQKENNYKWGKDLQEGLKRENKLLDQQLAKLQEKSKIQQKDLATRRAQLEAQGYQFSEDGSTITNAEAKLDALYAQYNQMIDNYNSMSADQQEEYKKQLDEEKKNIDKIEKGLKDYESLFSDYQGTLDSILDLHYQQIENAVSRFNNMVDVHLELDDARKEWNDFWYEVVEDAENLNFGTNIDYFEKKIEQSMGKLSTLLGIGGNAKDSEISTLTKHLNETVTQVEAQIASKNRGGEDSLFEDATKLSKENLETYREKLMSALREAKEEVNNIAENYLNLLDTAQKKIDKQIDGWESVSNHIEHNLELIKLVSGEKAFAPLLKQYDKLYETNLKTIEAQKTGQDYWADQIQKYEKLLKTTEEGTVQWKTYSQALDTASENYKKSVEGLDKSVEKALKDLEEWRKTQVESILDTLDKAMTHGAGLEFVKEEWNLINEYSSRYLDNVERAVEIQLYTNDLEKAANATGLTAKNQERINKFREEELKKLKEKEKLSQYDIDESRARLNILQQEIALEEARNNKSNMRLRRDSQGNYTYQYTGDEAAQDEAENGLLTAKKEWYELVKNRHKETTDWIIEDTQRYYDYIKKADEERAKGNEEGYKNYMNLAQEAYKAIEDDAAEMNKNAQDLLSGTAQFFSDVKDASILPTSKAMAASMNKDIGTIKEAGEKAVNALTATQEKFGEKTKKILEQAGINYENLTEKGIDPTQDALEDLNGTNEELEQSLEDVNKVLEEQEFLLAEAEEAYNNFKDAAVEALEAAQHAWEELAKTVIESQHQIQAEIQTTQQMQQQSNATSPSAFHSTRDDGGSGDGGNNSQQTDEYATKESGFGKTVIYKKSNPSQYIEAVDRNNIDEWKRKQLNAKYPGVSFATGGYTGGWDNSDGRLAVLHQKELVLNESDTSNLLKVINILRQVVASMNFSGIADSLVNSTTQWMNKAAMQPLTAGNISNISSVNNDTNNNYKNVTVNADFSGVQSAEAIYQALTELENYGMQESYSVAPYANKSY